MGDTFALHQMLAAGARSAVIVGGGYIGLEMAEAFCARGLKVTVVEQAPAVMPTVDLELGRLLGEELRRRGVRVVNDDTIKAIHQESGRLTVAGSTVPAESGPPTTGRGGARQRAAELRIS
jgi:NADPH-dependent 2,4-dienoyl-CoA reductase/sulfur reductase-like enzyme